MFRRFLHNIFPPNSPVASVSLVFFSVVIVAIFQLPARYFINLGHLEVGVAINEIIAVAGVPLLLITLLRFDIHRLLPMGRPSASIVAAAVILTIGSDVAIDYLMVTSEHFIAPENRVDLLYERLLAVHGVRDILIKATILCILPALCEEIYFRGFCQSSLEARFGKWPALLITSLLFALLHGNPYYMHLYFCLGILLGWIYTVTGSLRVAIVAHFLNNSWTFISHLSGMKLPLGDFPNSIDISIFIGGIVFVVVGVTLVKRSVCV